MRRIQAPSADFLRSLHVCAAAQPLNRVLFVNVMENSTRDVVRRRKRRNHALSRKLHRHDQRVNGARTVLQRKNGPRWGNTRTHERLLGPTAYRRPSTPCKRKTKHSRPCVAHIGIDRKCNAWQHACKMMPLTRDIKKKSPHAEQR